MAETGEEERKGKWEKGRKAERGEKGRKGRSGCGKDGVKEESVLTWAGHHEAGEWWPGGGEGAALVHGRKGGGEKKREGRIKWK
jgi:hypothetical protein